MVKGKGGGATRRITVVLVTALIAVPPSVMATIVLVPLWRWFERVAGIESIGHSGPAGWCYVFVYAVMAAALARRSLKAGGGGR